MQDSHDGAKRAFTTIVVPLARIAQSYLHTMPEHLRPPVLPTVDFRPLAEGLEYSYISLNIYWDAVTAPSLQQVWFNGKVWKRQSARHGGLYTHRDINNDGFGAVLTWGVNWTGFEQGYVTFSMELACPGWSIVVGNYHELLHFVVCCYLIDPACTMFASH